MPQLSPMLGAMVFMLSFLVLMILIMTFSWENKKNLLF
uniref:ATP synthase F0 subunit 8 n=1 Tax=Bulla sp. TLT-2006 TaxID=407128 RepID=E6Y151_9GAST|nr:ATP synthase F0 subunit 8 [Bulla sp. TLT-2006]